MSSQTIIDTMCYLTGALECFLGFHMTAPLYAENELRYNLFLCKIVLQDSATK